MYPNFFSTCYIFSMIIIIINTLIHIPMCLCVDNDQYVTCGTPIQCGNIQNTGYPFWGQRRPGYCGYPGFQLSCQVDNVPLITIQSLDFRVLAIDNATHTLTVARQDLWNNTCPTHLYNTTLDSALFSYGSNMNNVTLHYGCTATQQLPNQFNCTMNGTTSINYYSTAVGLNLAVCSSIVIVPVSQTSAQALESTSASVSDLEAALASGFGLQWSANNTRCTQCVKSGGRCGYNTNSGLFTCYCADQPYPLTCNLTVPTQSGGSSKWNLSLTLASVSLTVLGLISVVVVTIWCLRRRRLSIKAVVKNMNDQKVEALIRSYGSFTPKRYSYTDIKKMTNSFKDKLGQGGYGSVFKGKLSDSRLVAVKVLSEANGDGEEFINEVASMSRTSHVNVVTLLGFCFEGSKRALIYEFMPNRSLEKFICNDGSSNTSCRLEWKTLYKIAVGVARGLEYLHQGCNTRIVHFDIKPHNILLDEDFCPKISDFGLAKLCKRKESIVSMLVARGTPGYIAPEVFCRNFGEVSNKSDVYSYGMMVVEMVGARENIEVGLARTSELYFPDWIYEHLERDDDISLYGVTTEEEEETARKMILVSLWCIQTNPSVRPSMSKVVEMLEGSLQSLQIPPKPFVFSPSRQTEYTSASLASSL